MTSKRKRMKQYRAWCDEARTLAYENARTLALTITGGHQPAVPIYDLGIVLGADETVWQRAAACYWWRGEQTWTEQRTSYNGRRGTLTEVRRPVLNCAGTLSWLITNRRLGTRQPNGEVISIYWTAIQAISIDLAADAIVLDGTDGYRGELRGPAIAPVAVAAVASCHGVYALLDHPAVAPLRIPAAPAPRGRAGPATVHLTPRTGPNSGDPSTCRPRVASDVGPAGHTDPVVRG